MQIALILQFACNGEHIAQFAYPYTGAINGSLIGHWSR